MAHWDANENRIGSDVTSAVETRDSACRLTGAKSACGCRAARLITLQELNWVGAEMN